MARGKYDIEIKSLALILVIAFGKSRKIAPTINNIPSNSMRLTSALKKKIKIRVGSRGAKPLAKV